MVRQSFISLDLKLFTWAHHTVRHPILDFILYRLTHLGGATLTLSLSLCLYFFAKEPINIAGFHSFLAVVISHVPVAILKRSIRRNRPYLVLKNIHVAPNPLKDASFPSGHTTAIFAFVTPLIMHMPILAVVCLPIAILVSFSRIYMGLHYPSDCFVGFVIGTCTALITVII